MMASTMVMISASLFYLILPSISLLASGQEDDNQQQAVELTLNRSLMLPLVLSEGNQLRVTVNYEVNDDSIVGETINSVMGVYHPENGSLIKISSFPNGFTINDTQGTKEHRTTLFDEAIEGVTSIVVFTNDMKTQRISNDVRTDVVVGNVLPTTLIPQSE